MSATSEPGLPFEDMEGVAADVAGSPADTAARRHAVDPTQNVVLEASAGTGKTRVLVERYVNLLRAGVDPDHILAITFTRKAAAEMRERIIDRLRETSRLSRTDLVRWRDLKGRLADIGISTIDAFCLSLLRELPLEAGVDPGFELADDTEVPRLVAESLDQALRICRTVAPDDDDVALVFAQLGERRLRDGLAALLNRRLVAPQALGRYLQSGPRDLTASVACRRAAEALGDLFGGVIVFLDAGPVRHPQFAMLAADIRALVSDPGSLALDAREGQAALRALLDRLRAYFLTQDGRPRGKSFTGTIFKKEDCSSEDAWRRHRQVASDLAPAVAETILRFRRDLNVVLARGVWRIFAVLMNQYQRTLEAHALLDFSGVLEKAVRLLQDMDEFAESRFRLEARHRHVLVDELQDTSRAQWELVAQLVRNWAEGLGAGADALQPSIFVVSDRKQSIYGFRDADVAIVDQAAAFIEGLRTGGEPRRTITMSFRSAPALLGFVNDVFAAIVGGENVSARRDAFRYDDRDRFPIPEGRVPVPRFVEGKPDTTREQVRLKPDAAEKEVRLKPDATGREVRLMPDATEAEGRLMPDATEADAVALGLIAGASVTDAAERVGAEIARLLSSAEIRDRTTGVRRPAQPADIAVLFRSRDSHREFEKALGRRGILTYVYKGLGFFEAEEIQDATALLRYLADPLSDLRAATLLRSRLVRLSDPAVARLAPRLASAILDPAQPDTTAALSEEDRRVLARLREAVPRWLGWVDRLTPSELLTGILAETAYAGEMEGAGRRQARENLKKLRAIVRRFQNRGYATLARVAEHLDELAVGDESNAAIDAKDAVNLMTVHAAKGLEFPIVFVVNLGRGTGNTRAAIRVGSDASGKPSVAVADYQSEADEDAQAREREETKRLLYVALTRARDRLYLSTTVKDGACRMGRGSLGEVLPVSLQRLFTEAMVGGGHRLTWQGAPDGRVHHLVAVRSL